MQLGRGKVYVDGKFVGYATSFEVVMTTQTKPKTEDSIGQWPPVAHIIRNEDKPAKEGTIALCGAKLMGVDLSNDGVEKATCKACIEKMRQDRRLI